MVALTPKFSFSDPSIQFDQQVKPCENGSIASYRKDEGSSSFPQGYDKVSVKILWGMSSGCYREETPVLVHMLGYGCNYMEKPLPTYDVFSHTGHG